MISTGCRHLPVKTVSVGEDQSLLEEVTGLVEYPHYHGQIDDDFMQLPREILVTSMRSQKYFSFENLTARWRLISRRYRI